MKARYAFYLIYLLALAVAGCASLKVTATASPDSTPIVGEFVRPSEEVATPEPTVILTSTPTPIATTTNTPRLFSQLPSDTPGHLRSGSNPSVLPGPVLIADRNNNRLLVVDSQGRILWQFPQPGDLLPEQQFLVPDDAFFTPDGKQVVATHEDDFVVTLIDVASRRIVWQYGQPGLPGSGPNRLWNPDDAILLRNGNMVMADIKNCRVLVVKQGAHQPSQVLGRPGYCVHRPPWTLGAPNGAFPTRNGDLVITEIRGDWVDEITRDGRLVFSTHPPGVLYPSDTVEMSPGRYLTSDYSSPGRVVLFDQAGNQLWLYQPSGRDVLNHPSLAMPLPNGDIILTDDHNHRVIVVDPATNRIVWQYGMTGVPGRSIGLLDNPDGLDLVPPYSLMWAR